MWVDPWVLGFHTLQAFSSGSLEILTNTKVSSIIDSTTKGWDIDLVKAQFHPIVVGEILKMVLGSN